MKRLITVLVLMCVLLVGSAMAHGAEPVRLRIALYRGTAAFHEVENLFSEFTKEYPHIELELVPVYGNQLDRMIVEMIGGVGADVFGTWDEPAVLAMRHGFNMDLMPLIIRDDVADQFEDTLAATRALMTLDGGLYGIPQYQGVGGMFYNRDLFAESGIEEPSGDWTWDEFAATVRRLSRSDGTQVRQTGYTQFPQWIFFFPWLEQNGVDLNDPYKVPLDQPEAIQAVDFVKDLMDRGFIEWNWTAPFLEGRSAMFQSGSWEIRYLLEPNLRMGVTAPPSGPAGPSTFANTDIVSINRHTEHPEEAWLFVKWLYQSDVQRKYQELEGLQPARLSLIRYWIDDVHALFRMHGVPEVHGMTAFLTNSAFARPQPFFADPSVVKDEINPALHAIFVNNQAPASVLKTTAERANLKLEDAK